MHLYDVLRRPLITEKGSILQKQGKYLFKVASNATKTIISLFIFKIQNFYRKGILQEKDDKG